MKIKELEQKAIAAIDMPAFLHTLDEWVRVKSLDGEETHMQQVAAKTMEEIGLTVDTWEIDFDEVRRHPAYCEEVIREEGLGVVGVMGNGAGKSLILNGHIDVVPAGDLSNWVYPPWEATVADGNVYGRGALDMKGGLLCGLFAAKAIRDAGISLKGKLLIQSVIGEEDGGVGTLATILRGHHADAAIITEPTELMIAPAHAGALNFRITIPGFAAHGAVRDEGVSAIEKFIPIYQAIMAYEKERNAQIENPLFDAYPLPYPICIGTIKAGNWASTVAESCTFEGRFGLAVGEGSRLARQQFEQMIKEAASEDEWLRENLPTVKWWGGQFESAGIPLDEPIVTVTSQAFSDVTGTQPILQGMPYGADMRLLVRDAGIPTLMFGPGDVRKAHQPDEFVPLADLETVIKTLIVVILRFCGNT